MKRGAFVGVGIMVVMLVAFVAAASVASAGPPPDGPARKPPVVVPKAPITWSMPVISQTLTAGTIYTATVTFTSTRTITNAAILIAPGSPVRVRAIPSTIPLVQANTPTEVKIQISASRSLRQGRFNSMVFVRAGRMVLPQGLQVRVTVPKPSIGGRMTVPPKR